MKRLFYFVLALTFYSYSLFACEEVFQSIGKTKIQAGKFRDGTCYLYLSPKSPVDLKYRSYLFQDNGQIMIFNSFGPGNPATTTGSRLYRILEDELLFFTEKADSLEIQLGLKTIFEFDLHKFSISSSNNFTILEKPLDPNNNGGVEIFGQSIPFIDFGFKFGEVPISEKEREFSYFSKGNMCVAPNKLLYFYKNGEPIPQYKTNVDIISALNYYCVKKLF